MTKKSDKANLALKPTNYFRNQDPDLSPITAKQIVSGFSEDNRAFVKRVLKDILSSSDFSIDGNVEYQLRSGFGVPIIHERKLLRKLESFKLFKHVGEDGVFGIASLTSLNKSLINDVVRLLEIPRESPLTQLEPKTTSTRKQKNNFKISKKPLWRKDFKWMGKKFLFGEYGNTGRFKSKNRLAMFKELAKAKGNWVSIRKLREITGQGDVYIRPTIGQIEKAFTKELRSHIEITSTREDDFEPKPTGGEGAYRIKLK